MRSAAYTSNLGKFVNSLCSKLQAQIKTDDASIADEILNGGQDRALLKLLREETTMIVLMVRVVNQERKEEWEARQAEQEQEETESLQPGFGLPLKEEKENLMDGIKIVDGKIQFDYDKDGMLPAKLTADFEDFVYATGGTEEDFLQMLQEKLELSKGKEN